MQEAHAMPLASASLSLLQKGHRRRGVEHVASYVAEQAAYPLRQSGDENIEADNPASPRNSTIILLGEEAAGPSRSAGQGHVQPEGCTGTRPKCDGESDESPGAALMLAAKTVSRKRQHYDSSLVSPIKENNAEDGIRYGSETTFVSWSTSPARKPADTSQRTAARKEVFEKRKRYKMHESRQKSATEKTSRKKEKHRKKQNKAQEPRIPKPAFGALTSSAVESEHLSGARLTVRPQIAAGLFHKGRVSGLRARAALPDLTFCEMNFLRGAPLENHLIEQVGEGGGGKSKTHPEHDSNERISSYFNQVNPLPPGKENLKLPGALSRSRHHTASPKIQDKRNQINTAAGCSKMPILCRQLSRDSLGNNRHHPLERRRFPSKPLRPHNSPLQNRMSASPGYIVPHSEPSTNRQPSISSPRDACNNRPRTPPSEINPVLTWLSGVIREYPAWQEGGLRDRCSYPGSSAREFNELDSRLSPPSSISPPNSPAPHGTIEQDANLDGWSIAPNVGQHTDRSSLYAFNSISESVQNSGDIAADAPRYHQTSGVPPLLNGYPNQLTRAQTSTMHEPNQLEATNKINWGNQMGETQASISDIQTRKVEANSPHLNSRDIFAKESGYLACDRAETSDWSAINYSSFTQIDADLGDRRWWPCDQEMLGDSGSNGPTTGPSRPRPAAVGDHMDDNPGTRQFQNRPDQPNIPELGYGLDNFWRPHRLY
ncbi:hypothetical protein TWF730_007848 [Orbilia blumenaviensis]|uniref:Uncharacterized protein n=1 Tax=Orbilia blumenaviensis TaxID=1796055 RepID=A0AAV9VBY8_9PEZI